MRRLCIWSPLGYVEICEVCIWRGFDMSGICEGYVEIGDTPGMGKSLYWSQQVSTGFSLGPLFGGTLRVLITEAHCEFSPRRHGDTEEIGLKDLRELVRSSSELDASNRNC